MLSSLGRLPDRSPVLAKYRRRCRDMRNVCMRKSEHGDADSAMSRTLFTSATSRAREVTNGRMLSTLDNVTGLRWSSFFSLSRLFAVARVRVNDGCECVCS